MTRDTPAAVLSAVACPLLQTAMDIKDRRRGTRKQVMAAINKLQALIDDPETLS